MAPKKVFLIETQVDGLKTIKSYFSEINANFSTFRNLDEAGRSESRPDLIVLLVNKRTECFYDDIEAYKRTFSVSRIPLFAMLPPGLNSNEIKREGFYSVFQMPVEKLSFLTKVAKSLGIPPRRVFKIVVTIVEEASNIRYSGVSVDFSESGMSFESGADFPLRHRVLIRFINPKRGDKFSLNAEIVRRSESDRKGNTFYGVKFTGVDESHTRALRNFISGENDSYKKLYH